MHAQPASPQFLPAQRQLELYLDGRRDEDAPGAIPLSFERLAAKAQALLSEEDWDWLAGGAGGGDTMRANRDALARWRIVPRMLRDVARRDLSIELLGARLPSPVLLAPIGVQRAAHPEGELAVARAAADLGVPFVVSTVATATIEDIAAAMGDAPRWFQLYWPKAPELAASFLRRAEAAGYGAIVVTLDTQSLGWRESNLRLGHLPFLKGIGLQNYFSDPVFRSYLERPPEEDPEAAARCYLGLFSDLGRTWSDLAWIRDRTRLPILVKGIQHADDARRALDQGVDGICVSNHGGRQVDGAIGSFQALRGIVDAVAGRAPILFDSGIRRGCDVIKAMAMGADAVMVGRPYLYALAVGGEAGVRTWLRNFLADIDISLALSGHASPADLDRSDLACEA
jgi:isopentenyl diphosphate isomerase/L-lactate dehydrogenase-like FMN-dependent dehydrogenase